MFTGLSRDLRTMALSVLVASLVVAVPATAAVMATNSDKVDGKHAVGAKASVSQRAGKLVATGRNGKFPNNVIAKAPDANRLDGLDATAFLGAGAKAADADQLDGKDSTEFMSSDDAWAYVISNGGLHASSGNLTVTRPALGQYCVVVSKRGSHKAAQVTLADPAGLNIVSVGTGHGSACNPLSTATHDVVPVYGKTPAGAAVDVNFTIYIPAP